MLSWKNPDYARNPKAHAGHGGMHRWCEANLLRMLSSGMSGMVVIGCGLGKEFFGIDQTVRCLGIDRLDPMVIVQGSQDRPFEYWQRELLPDGATFSPEVVEELSRWSQTIDGNILWYTDNGFKIAELIAMHKLCSRGDVIGTHDFSTEVPLDGVPFLADSGFRYMDECDFYINEFFCLQGFWKKV